MTKTIPNEPLEWPVSWFNVEDDMFIDPDEISALNHERIEIMTTRDDYECDEFLDDVQGYEKKRYVIEEEYEPRSLIIERYARYIIGGEDE